MNCLFLVQTSSIIRKLFSPDFKLSVSPKNAAKGTVLRLKGKRVWLVDQSRLEQICENARFIIDSTISTAKDAWEMSA